VVKNLTTIILPQWFLILKQHAEVSIAAKQKPLSLRMMPWDVATQWNSTFDMLEFTLLYRKLLDELTGIREMKLQSYELSEIEWMIAKKLSGVLKVCHFTYSQFVAQSFSRSSSRRPSFSQLKHQTSRRSSLLWTTLISTSRLVLSIRRISPQSGLPC